MSFAGAAAGMVQGDDEGTLTVEEANMFPDYGFPIVYHLLNHNEYVSANTPVPNLNNYIFQQTNACNRTQPAGPAPLFISSQNEVCVLFMSWESSSHLDVLKSNPDKTLYHNLINDIPYLNRQVIGHAKMLYFNNNLAIYNFCKHTLAITGAPGQAATISPRETPFGPHGFAMFTALLTAAQLMPGVPPNSNLWLAIDLDNPSFSKVAKIYTVCGFSNPFITDRDVNDAQLPFRVLQLTRPLHAHAARHLESVNNFNQVMNLYHNFNAVPQRVIDNLARYNARILRYRFSFDRSCIMSLRLFPYLAFSAIGTPVNITRVDAQRETSGKFLSIKSEYSRDNPAHGHDVLAFETVATTNQEVRILYNTGTVNSVDMVFSEATFHTHPIANYRTYMVSIAPPSTGDFFAFVKVFAFLQSPAQIAHRQSFKFSVISTVEGLYIISLSPDGIHNFTRLAQTCQNEAEFDTRLQMIANTYDYTAPTLDWTAASAFDNLRSMGVLNVLTADYTAWFEQTNTQNGNLFALQFISWDDFNVIDKFEVYYLENRINLP
jgi:hypothetical protein